MEVAHTDFTEVTRVVLVHVRAVVVLTTGETTTTGMLPVLAYTTVTGRDVAAAVVKNVVSEVLPSLIAAVSQGAVRRKTSVWWLWRGLTYCLRV